jgi:hypothetical protein
MARRLLSQLEHGVRIAEQVKATGTLPEAQNIASA